MLNAFPFVTQSITIMTGFVKFLCCPSVSFFPPSLVMYQFKTIALSFHCVFLIVVLQSLKEGDHLVWDKDDKNAMDFVAACANIRAHIFGIPQKTRFDIKCKYNLTHLAVIQVVKWDKMEQFSRNIS